MAIASAVVDGFGHELGRVDSRPARCRDGRPIAFGDRRIDGFDDGRIVESWFTPTD